MRKLLICVFLYCFSSIHCIALTLDTLYLKKNVEQTVTHLEGKYFFYEKDLPIEYVIQQNFKEKSQLDLSYITGWIWVRLVIKNDSEYENFVLNASDGHVSGFYMYKPISSGYAMTPPGVHHPEDGRELYNRLPCFYITIPKGETRTFYIKINSINEIINFNYIIRNESNFADFIQQDYLIIGLYFGALLIVILINIFYYFSLKDTIFLSYILFVFGNFLFTATLDGFTWLWIPNPIIAYHLCLFCFRLWGDSVILFIMQLVNLRQHNKLLNQIGFAFIIYHSGVIAIVDCFFESSMHFMHQLESINWLISIILVLIIIAKSYKNNRYLFKYYIISFFAILGSFLFLLFHTVGNAENYLIFEHGMKAGTLVEMLTLSFAVSRRFRITEQDLKRKQEEEQQLTDQVKQLEMDVRKAQMNPHFMFNALTSIEHFIMKNKSELACDYLEKFANLMRLTLDNSRNDYIYLEDDLKALQYYVELEFLRLKHQAHVFELEVDKQIKEEEFAVPALLIQPFVENAIWHGLQKRMSPGKLSVKIRFANNMLLCTIEDDGGGIPADRGPVKRKSSGILITKERLNLIHVILKSTCQFEIENIKNENGDITGTRVQFSMPYIRE